MMISLERIGDSITGSCNNKPFGLKYTPEKWKLLVSLKKEADDASTLEDLKEVIERFEKASQDNLKEYVETNCEDLMVHSITGDFYLKVNNKIINIKIPKAIADRILKSIDMDISPKPIIKACIRFFRNPNFSESKFKYFANYINTTTVLKEVKNKLIEQGYSAEIAEERATVYQTPITQEGLICTYKVSKEVDFKYALNEDNEKIVVPRYPAKIDEDTGIIVYDIPEFMEDRLFMPAVMGEGGDAFEMINILSGETKVAHRIKVGCIHKLEQWSQVNCTDGEACVKGLHVGNIDYIQGFQKDDTVTHNVFVDPMFIGGFTDKGTGAIRVKEYFVHSSLQGITKTLYHSSTYGKLTDAAWETIKLELIEKFKSNIVDTESHINEILAI